jgi:hypothetical protein
MDRRAIAAELKSPKVKSAPMLPFSDDEMDGIFDSAREIQSVCGEVFVPF